MEDKTAKGLFEIAWKNAKKVHETEKISVEDASGRILSEDIIPASGVPPFKRSAVDGFAIISSDISNKNISKFKVSSVITAGYSRELPHLESGEAAFVTTGAPVPLSADSVVLIEDAESYAGGYMVYNKPVEKGSYLSLPGDDIKPGELLLRKGTRLRFCDIAALAGIGSDSVSVYRKPVIGILSGGNELVSPGEKLAGCKIYDVNTTVLKALIKDAGGVPEVIGTVEDDMEKIVQMFSSADISGKYDLIISTGGTGASFLVLENKEIQNFYDLVPAAIANAGKLLFHGVRLVPGKPTSFGILSAGTPIFALAGWPYAVLITFDLFIRPYIQKISNSQNIHKRYPTVEAVLSEEVHKESGVRKYFQVKLEYDGEKIKAAVIQGPKPPSAARSLGPMIKADGSFVMEEKDTVLTAGATVKVELNDYERLRAF